MAEYFAGGHLRFVNGEWRDDNGNAIEISRVRHGRIIETIVDGRMKRVFSCCGVDFTKMTSWMTTKYCPNCGAKIDKGE